MIGRSERAAPEIEGYWEKGSTFPNFLYRCADGELIQVWFGGKGMYGSRFSATSRARTATTATGATSNRSARCCDADP